MDRELGLEPTNMHILPFCQCPPYRSAVISGRLPPAVLSAVWHLFSFDDAFIFYFTSHIVPKSCSVVGLSILVCFTICCHSTKTPIKFVIVFIISHLCVFPNPEPCALLQVLFSVCLPVLNPWPTYSNLVQLNHSHSKPVNHWNFIVDWFWIISEL